MTVPDDITQEDYKRIYQDLCTLKYPCTVVVYAPERTGITRYNGSIYGSEFHIDYCRTVDDAWRLVDCGYIGHPSYFRIYAVPSATPDDDGGEQPKEL